MKSFYLLSLLACGAQAFVQPNAAAFGNNPRRSSSSSSSIAASSSVDADTTDTVDIESTMQVLYRAAEAKTEDPDAVVAALLDLEKAMRQKNKQADSASSTDATFQALSGNGGGSWQLVFTTGTINTQQKTGRINYFPIKATQSFNNAEDPWLIENGIYLGDFPLLKFKGDFDWTVQNSGVTKVTFDFTSILLLNTFDIQLKAGQASNLGAKTGLGSENNVELEKKGKRPFFNWISADDKIATARGGGGGLALWKRIDYEGGQ